MSILNRGLGAGGAMTNASGKAFEQATCNIANLMSKGFTRVTMDKTKYGYYLEKDNVLYFSQSGLKKYIGSTYNCTLFRDPDEAYLIKKNGKYILKILEKKCQNVDGSVDVKLCAAGYFIKEYKNSLDDRFEVEYAFCLSKFLQEKYVSDEPKYTIMRKIHKEENVQVFFGEESDYLTKLSHWLGFE